MAIQAFVRETNLREDFMDVKDFFYNFGKSLDIFTILENKDYRPHFMTLFYNFIDKEYSPLHFSKKNLSLLQIFFFKII